MPALRLILHDREEIRAGLERHESDVVISARLGRHRCTIKSEIRRNGGRDRYRATAAQAQLTRRGHARSSPSSLRMRTWRGT